MSHKKSAGLLLFRFINSDYEFLLVHPGGPYWFKKDLGAWSIPKGEFSDDEDPLEAAKREFKEETGINVSGNFTALQPLKQKSGKLIYAWILEADIATDKIKSNTFELEWPPRSGKKIQVPEIDRAEWFTSEKAKQKINPGQRDFIYECEKHLKGLRRESYSNDQTI